MTAVDRPDNGQDEGRCAHPRAGQTSLVNLCTAACTVACRASGRAGAGERQREQLIEVMNRHGVPAVGNRAFFTELLALLGGPQPDGEAEPCPVYSHGTDGWHCAVTGDHDQHTNAAGDETW